MPSTIRAVAGCDKLHFIQTCILILFLEAPAKHKEYLNQPIQSKPRKCWTSICTLTPYVLHN